MKIDLNNFTELYLIINEKALDLKKVEFAQYPLKPVCSRNALRKFCKDFFECKNDESVDSLIKKTPRAVIRKFVAFAHMAMDAVEYKDIILLPHSYKNWWEILSMAVLDFFEYKQSNGKIPLSMFKESLE